MRQLQLRRRETHFTLALAIALFGALLTCGAEGDEVDERATRPDGAVRLTIPEGGESNQNPCFSPDGSFLVFTRFENGYNDGPAHLYRLDLEEGAEPVQLTDGDYDDVNVPFGCFDQATGRVVFASDRGDANDLWTIDPDPTHPDLRRSSDHGELPVWIEPVMSPDSAFIAFEIDNESATEEGQRARIAKIEVASGTVTELTNRDGTLDDRLPSWSPDGSRILFQRRDPTQEESLDRWEAWTIDVDGGEPTDVSAGVEREQAGPDTDLSWTPSGTWVLSSANHGGIEHPNIFMLPVSGGPMVRVTFEDEHEDGAPCASPDGTRITFESHRTADEDSPSDLWIIDTPAVGRR